MNWLGYSYEAFVNDSFGNSFGTSLYIFCVFSQWCLWNQFCLSISWVIPLDIALEISLRISSEGEFEFFLQWNYHFSGGSIGICPAIPLEISRAIYLIFFSNFTVKCSCNSFCHEFEHFYGNFVKTPSVIPPYFILFTYSSENCFSNSLRDFIGKCFEICSEICDWIAFTFLLKCIQQYFWKYLRESINSYPIFLENFIGYLQMLSAIYFEISRTIMARVPSTILSIAW